MSTSTRQRRTLEPIDTCPLHLLEHYRGDCLACRMPMAAKRTMTDIPDLGRWFMRACGELCSTCYSRARERPATREGRRQEHADYVHRARPEDIPRLRAMVGACVQCGWTSDSGPHKARDCPTQQEVA